MKCDRIREDLGAYLDNELDSARCSELEGHLASCEACAAELHRLRKLLRLVADVPRATAPAGLAARIVSAAPVSAARMEPDVPAAPGPGPRVLRLSRWTGGLAAVAAVLLIGVVTIVTLRERDSRDMVGRVAETSDEESAAAPAAGEDAGATLDWKKLGERAETERRVFARKGLGPAKRRGDMRKKEAASKVAEAAAASGPPAARVHRKGAPPPDKKAIAARTPAPSKPARPRPKGKAAAAPSTPREPVVGKRGGFRARRGKAGPGGRDLAQQAVPARGGEQVQVEAPRPEPKAEESGGSRQRLVDLVREREDKEGLEGKKEKGGLAEALLAKMGKAKAPAREDDRAGGEPVIRLQLRAGSSAKELARIIAAARQVGGESAPQRIAGKAVQRRAVRPSARGRPAADEATPEQPSVVRVRIPRGRTGDFLAFL